MPLSKVKAGSNMYQGWVSHVHTHIGGECPHKCPYCYVQAMERRFKGGKYAGPLKLIESELQVNYGKDRTIFIEHCNDMWAADVSSKWINKILNHCNEYPDNIYVFQTKNPARYYDWLPLMPPSIILGCTIETTDELSNQAPSPFDRYVAMDKLSMREKTFITIEPILKGNMEKLAGWIDDIYPEFVNIGADSKGTGLDEPSADDIRYLIDALNEAGIEIRQKSNLGRLLK